MQNYPKYGLLLLLFFALHACGVREDVPSVEQMSDTSGLPFPADWSGRWTGMLRIFSHGRQVHRVPMQLTISPQGDSIRWAIQYDSADVRAYTLVAVDTASGLYVMDEHNSIRIETYLFGNKLIARYEVAGSDIVVTETLLGDELWFEVLASPLAPVSRTGDTVWQGDTIPPVKTYPVQVYQRARLKRAQTK